uniref:Trace amine-associated receptor 1 n=2 Tax=Tetraodon nigroviridis TaxID=99883 RepID=H3C5J9_TETNG
MEPVFCFEKNISCVKTVYPLPFRVILYMVLGVMVVVTVCGNLLVTVSIIYFKQLHTPTNYLLVSLAVSDFLLGFLVMLPDVIQSVETCWYFGDILCKVHLSSDVMLCTASIMNLSLIAIDRYNAVIHPLVYRRKMSGHVVLLMIFFSWSVSGVVGFGMIFFRLNIFGTEDFYNNFVACEGKCLLFQRGLSGTVLSVLSFYIPGIIMISVYLKIFFVAKKQFLSIQNTTCMTSARDSDKKQAKATKTLVVIMGAFLLCWAPFFLCHIIDPLISYSTPAAMFETFVWLGYINSTLNPLIYAFSYTWFRKAFRLFASGKVFKAGYVKHFPFYSLNG